MDKKLFGGIKQNNTNATCDSDSPWKPICRKWDSPGEETLLPYVAVWADLCEFALFLNTVYGFILLKKFLIS